MSDPLVSVLIPAYQEELRVGETAAAAGEAMSDAGWSHEIIVVDDGSSDGTGNQAAAAGASVLRLERNTGKGGAVERGLGCCRGEVILMLDADLGSSAIHAAGLIQPVLDGQADMTIAVLPSQPGSGGFGWVMRLARRKLGEHGAGLTAPISGQRAIRRAALNGLLPLDAGFGLETGLNLAAAKSGLRLLEVPVNFSHRITGPDPGGFLHRGRQFIDILRVRARR